MRHLFSAALFFAVVIGLLSCKGPLDSSGNEDGDSALIERTELTGAPVVELPEAYTGDGEISVGPSSLSAPSRFPGGFVPVGVTWDVSVDGSEHLSFAPNRATLRFLYDPSDIVRADVYNEFVVFVFEDDGGSPADVHSWSRLDRFSRESAGEQECLVAETEHFSTFVAAAAAASTGTVVGAPGMDDVFPSGLAGTAGAEFTLIDEDFAYYLDRDYFVVPVSQSTENQRTFDALGLDGSIGIATYNGGSATQPYGDHKYYDGQDYIVFDAHMDLDVYVMYDTRGGAGPADTTEDATWLDTLGFGDLIDGEPYYVETTDPVGLYRIYKSSYLEGETVRLHGNWYDDNTDDLVAVDAGSIQTNYWVIIKPLGSTSSDSADAVAAMDATPPGEVTDLDVESGLGTVSIAWTNPSDGDFASVRISYGSSEPTTLYSGTPNPSGTIISGLPSGAHIFRIQTVDAAGNMSEGTSFRLNPANSVCGDTIVEPVLGEECDDGNINNGDGCSAECLFE